jgi:hypothetical protein
MRTFFLNALFHISVDTANGELEARHCETPPISSAAEMTVEKKQT